MSFLGSYWMNYFTAELKPYATDVLVAGLYCLYFHYQKQFESETPSRKLYLFAALLPFSIFFSYGGLFFIWIPIYNFILLTFKNKKLWSVLFLNLIMASFCLFVFYKIDVRHSMYNDGILGYWKDYFLSFKSPSLFYQIKKKSDFS